MKPLNHGKEWTRTDFLTFLKTAAETTPGFFSGLEAIRIFDIKMNTRVVSAICQNIHRSPEAVETIWDKMVDRGKFNIKGKNVTNKFCSDFGQAYKEFKLYFVEKRADMLNKPKSIINRVMVQTYEMDVTLHESIEDAQEEIKKIIGRGSDVAGIDVFYSETGITKLDLSLQPILTIPK